MNRRHFLKVVGATALGLSFCADHRLTGKTTDGHSIETHYHPYYKGFRLEHAVSAMERNEVDVACLEYQNGHIFDRLLKQAKRLKGYEIEEDNLMLKLSKEGKSKYFLRAKELTSSDGFHFLTIGSDNIKCYPPDKRIPSERIIKAAARQNAFLGLSHPFASITKSGEIISNTQRDLLWRLCRDYQGMFFLEWNALFCPLTTIYTKESVNGELLQFKTACEFSKLNVKIYTATDGHARSDAGLDEMGKARIEARLDLSSGTSAVASLKESIKSGEAKMHYEYAGLKHLIFQMLPYVKLGEKTKV